MSSQPAQNILECFRHRLPDFDYPTWPYHRTHFSSTTVAEFDPPKLLIKQKTSLWVDRGGDRLRKPGIPAALRAYYLSKVEVPFLISTEADIVRATILYFCHPVKVALEKICRRSILLGSEVQSPRQNISLRADMVFYYVDANRRNRIPFAILEVKRPGTIDKQQFSSVSMAQRNEDERQHEYQQRYDQLLEYAESKRTGTLLQDNCRVIAQQAGAYGFEFGTSYVACLDWASLILFQFDSLGTEGCGNSALVAYVTDTNHAYMRQVFLGWLCSAYAKLGGDFR